jgi:hypothetical protein
LGANYFVEKGRMYRHLQGALEKIFGGAGAALRPASGWLFHVEPQSPVQSMLTICRLPSSIRL